MDAEKEEDHLNEVKISAEKDPPQPPKNEDEMKDWKKTLIL